MIRGFPVGDTYKGIAVGESLQGDSLSGVPIKRIFLGESLLGELHFGILISCFAFGNAYKGIPLWGSL